MSNPQYASPFFDFNWNQPSAMSPPTSVVPPPYLGFDFNPYFGNGMLMPPAPVSPLLVDVPSSSYGGSLGHTPPPLDYSQFYTNPMGGIHSQFAQIFIQSQNQSGMNNLGDPYSSKPSGSVIFDPRILNCESLRTKETHGEENHHLHPSRPRQTSLTEPISLYDSSDAGDSPQAVYKSHKAGKMHFCGQEGCDYKTDRKNNLFRHARTMHGYLENGRLQPCCGITFNTKTQYRQHIRACHSEGYKCSWEGCPKVFPRKALLMRHFKIHTGEKAFFCSEPDCAYTTNHKSNLDRHINTHQKRQLNSSTQVLLETDTLALSPKIEVLPPTSSPNSETTIHHFSFTLPDPADSPEDGSSLLDGLGESTERVKVQLSYPKLSSMPAMPLLFDEDPPDALEHQSILSDINN